jgi:hypothetical protein
MKRILMSISFIVVLTSFGFAQEYKTGIGLRGGWFNGITVKHFIGENKALEGILSTRWRGFNITGLYEVHHNAFDVAGLNWYYGGGGHIGFWEGSNVKWSSNSNAHTVIGIDGILGLEYNFDEFPINISVDWKPAFNIIGHSGFWGDGGAFSIRYIF